jgi:hypothetical protein
MTTQANLLLARSSTVYGTTSSSEYGYLIRDIFMQGIVYTRQAIRYAVRKLLRKTVLVTSVNTENVDSEILKTESAKKAIVWAKEEGYVTDSAELKTLPYWIMERLLNLYFIHDIIIGNEVACKSW